MGTSSPAAMKPRILQVVYLAKYLRYRAHGKDYALLDGTGHLVNLKSKGT